jgi:hypothetical protein
MKLEGGERLVLKVLRDLQGDSTDYVDDARLASAAKMIVEDLRDWLETLEGKGFVERARGTAGFSAYVTAKGKQALRLIEPIPSPTPREPDAGPGSSSLADTPVNVRLNPQQDPAVALRASPSGLDSSFAPVGDPANRVSAAGTTSPASASAKVRAPICVFFSYSHDDEPLRNELAKHLSLLERQGVISAWHDRMITAGDEWKDEIDQNLEKAQVILLLVSASFMASDYCFDIETKRAIERHNQGEARVIPILIRTCDWKSAPFAKLTALPTNWKAVTSWSNQDDAWTDVALGVRRAVEAMTANSQ